MALAASHLRPEHQATSQLSFFAGVLGGVFWERKTSFQATSKNGAFGEHWAAGEALMDGNRDHVIVTPFRLFTSAASKEMLVGKLLHNSHTTANRDSEPNAGGLIKMQHGACVL